MEGAALVGEGVGWVGPRRFGGERIYRLCWDSNPGYSSPYYGPYIYLLSLLTPHSRCLLQKLTGSQLVKKFPAYYGTGRFVTAFIRTRHLSLSWARSIQSMLLIPLP